MRWLLCGAMLLVGTYAALAKDAGAPDAAKADPSTVTISVRTFPSGAKIYHGKKLLGTAPISFQRKRDSGPLDLIVRRGGYFPVATRAYTFKDDIVIVKLTHRDNASTLYGYKEPLPPDAGPPTSQPTPTQP